MSRNDNILLKIEILRQTMQMGYVFTINNFQRKIILNIQINVGAIAFALLSRKKKHEYKM